MRHISVEPDRADRDLGGKIERAWVSLRAVDVVAFVSAGGDENHVLGFEREDGLPKASRAAGAAPARVDHARATLNRVVNRANAVGHRSRAGFIEERERKNLGLWSHSLNVARALRDGVVMFSRDNSRDVRAVIAVIAA